jgi:hypothetical protein
MHSSRVINLNRMENSLEIGEQEQQDRDFDWFCIDEAGNIGHFTTAGFKRLPASVAKSAEDLDLVTKYFRDQLPVCGGHQVDDGLVTEIPDPMKRGERYLRSFVGMADKGIYSFDIEPYLKTDISYFRVASPLVPTRFRDLPARVQEIVGRTVLTGKLLSCTSRVPYQDTLGM